MWGMFMCSCAKNDARSCFSYHDFDIYFLKLRKFMYNYILNIWKGLIINLPFYQSLLMQIRYWQLVVWQKLPGRIELIVRRKQLALGHLACVWRIEVRVNYTCAHTRWSNTTPYMFNKLLIFVYMKCASINLFSCIKWIARFINSVVKNWVEVEKFVTDLKTPVIKSKIRRRGVRKLRQFYLIDALWGTK